MKTVQILRDGQQGVLDVLGPTIEFLVPPAARGSGYCVFKGVIQAGGAVPLHSHPDDESFLLLSGQVSALLDDGASRAWRDVNPGEFVHVPANAPHAWKNNGGEPAVELVITTVRLGNFFQEVGQPLDATKPRIGPAPEELQRFVDAARRYGHWLGTPAENAAIGITLPG